LGHPSKFQRVSLLGFVSAATSVTGGQPNFAACTMFGCLLGCYTICTFLGAVAPPDGISPHAKLFTLHPSLAFSYISSVTARHSSSERQPNSAAWYKEWNYQTFAEGATYIRLGGHHVGHQPTF